MNDNRRVALAYLSVCIFWGSTYLAIRVSMKDTAPAVFGAFRFLSVGLIMLGFCYIKGLKLPTRKEDIFKISLQGIMLLFLANGLLMIA